MSLTLYLSLFFLPFSLGLPVRILVRRESFWSYQFLAQMRSLCFFRFHDSALKASHHHRCNSQGSHTHPFGLTGFDICEEGLNSI